MTNPESSHPSAETASEDVSAPTPEPSLDELAKLYVLPTQDDSASPSTDMSIPAPTTLPTPNLKEDDLNLGLTPEEIEFCEQRFTKLKELLEIHRAPELVKDFFHDSDVAAVIAGAKPMSYVQKVLEERKWGILKKRLGLSKENIELIHTIGNELGVDILRNEELEKERNVEVPSMKHLALMLVINKEMTIEAMRTSEAFTEEEIQTFIDDPLLAQLQIAKDAAGKQDYVRAFRTGYQYGYPTSAVVDFIKQLKIRNKPLEEQSDEEREFVTYFDAHKQGVSVNGMQGNVGWVTTDPHSPESKMFETKLGQVFEIQKSIFET